MPKMPVAMANSSAVHCPDIFRDRSGLVCREEREWQQPRARSHVGGGRNNWGLVPDLALAVARRLPPLS